MTREQRFWSKVQRSDGCWEWQGSLAVGGYGQIMSSRRRCFTHRASWEINVGTIPPGLHVLHRCDNPSCVRPDHLFLGSHADNMADKAAKGRAARERNGNAKLSEADVIAMRFAHVIAGVTGVSLGPAMGVTVQHANAILRRATWA